MDQGEPVQRKGVLKRGLKVERDSGKKAKSKRVTPRHVQGLPWVTTGEAGEE